MLSLFLPSTSTYCLSTLHASPQRPRMPQPRATAVESIDLISHNRFLSEVAMVMPPPALGSVVGILASRGEELVEPGQDASLHPFLVPLTRNSDGLVTGLLRWPAAGGGGSKLPVVQTSKCGRQLMLLASSAEAFVAREAVMADVSASSDAAALAELSAKVGFPYTAGDAASSAGGACGYLITKIGPFNSAYEELADNHFANGESVCEDTLLLSFTRMASHPLPLHLSRRLRFSSASLSAASFRCLRLRQGHRRSDQL